MATRKNRKSTLKTTKKNKGGATKGSRSPRVLKFKDKDGTIHTLTKKQRLFCRSFIQYDGNAVDAVIEAGYECFYPNSKEPNRKAASAIASENLRKPNIIAYISSLFENTGLNDSEIEKHWLFNIQQYSDLGAKNKAIDMYLKVKGRYAPEKHDHVIKSVEIVKYDDIKDQTSS